MTVLHGPNTSDIVLTFFPLHPPPTVFPPLPSSLLVTELGWLAQFNYIFLFYTFYRRRPLNRSHLLHELFPVFTYLPFPKEASLKKCFLLQPEPIVGSKVGNFERTWL